VTTEDSIATVFEMRSGWPFMQTSPKNWPGSSIAITGIGGSISLSLP